ncbi:MAG: Crp/Fnr family transcriptional regulator [Clostridia bacterium]|nr:Crp/Fnr family transcriptional regulator [Clostridia bacterium]
MKQTYLKLILAQKLFDGCQPRMIEDIILGSGTLHCFRSGEAMESEERAVGILLSGRGVIYSSDKGRQTLLRFISPGDAVGVAGLFADKAPNTRIYACGDGKSEMFFVGRKAFEELMAAENDGRFRINLIKFLSDRVTFLNSKIDFVTGGSAERRLVMFLKNSSANNKGEIEIGMSMTALAHALDIGRASLYRAFDALVEDGAISRDGKSVKILAPELLDNY